MIKCINCDEPTRNPKFCDNSCAATYNNKNRQKKRSEYSIDKTSKSLKQYYKDNPRIVSNICKLKQKQCVICRNIKLVSLYNKAKTCSNSCRRELARQNALTQQKHGYGKHGYYQGILCDSTYELAFVIYCLDHNIQVARSTLRISYVLNNKNKIYVPDFQIDDTIYEIKGYDRGDVLAKEAAIKILGYKYKILFKQDLALHFDHIYNKYKTRQIETLFDTYKPKYYYICKYCDNGFESNRLTSEFCSRSCAGKYRANERKLMRRRIGKVAWL